VVGCGLDSYGSGFGPEAGCCEHGNEPCSSIKGGEFIDQLRINFCGRTPSRGVNIGYVKCTFPACGYRACVLSLCGISFVLLLPPAEARLDTLMYETAP
jgi:hypothetical protein